MKASGVSNAPHQSGQRSRQGLLLQYKVLFLISGFFVLFFTLFMSLSLGAKSITFEEIRAVLSGKGDTYTAAVVWSVRIPRTLIGLAVGAALGLSGALMQSVTRNPLADPGLLGINAGASAGMVLALQYNIGSTTGGIWAALAGAAVTTLFVYVIGNNGAPSGRIVRMTLTGVAVNAVMISIVSGTLILNQPTMEAYRLWSVGAIAGRPLEVLCQTGPFLAIGIVLTLTLGHPLNIMALGDDLSKSLGGRNEIVKAVAIAANVMMCGAATATVGPVGFVGLIIPHVVRVIVGGDQRWLLFLSMIMAPVLLLWADIIGRIIAPPGEIEVGIVVAFIGSPFFIYLIRKKKVIAL